MMIRINMSGLFVPFGGREGIKIEGVRFVRSGDQEPSSQTSTDPAGSPSVARQTTQESKDTKETKETKEETKKQKATTEDCNVHVNYTYHINVAAQQQQRAMPRTTFESKAQSLESTFLEWARHLSGKYKGDLTKIWNQTVMDDYIKAGKSLDRKNFNSDYHYFLTDKALVVKDALLIVRKQQRALNDVTLLDIVLNESAWTDFNGLTAQIMFRGDQQISQGSGRYQTAIAMHTALNTIQTNQTMHTLAFARCKFHTSSRKFEMLVRR